jgi:hypothetical protein
MTSMIQKNLLHVIPRLCIGLIIASLLVSLLAAQNGENGGLHVRLAGQSPIHYCVSDFCDCDSASPSIVPGNPVPEPVFESTSISCPYVRLASPLSLTDVFHPPVCS